MAELNCAICDREVGFMGQIKLADEHFICKDCLKKVSPFFEPSESSVETYNGNLKQNADGQKLYDAYFSKNKKIVKLCDSSVIFDPGTMLICIYGERGGIFDKKKFYTVFRMADLEKYEPTSRFQRDAKGANNQVNCICLSFASEGEGIRKFMIPADAANTRKLIREFDHVLGGGSRALELAERADAAIREVLK